MYDTLETINNFLGKFNIKKIKTKSKQKIKYYNIPCTFDIESTSAYLDNKTGETLEANYIANKKEKEGCNFDEARYEKIAFMYIWQMSIDDNLIIGRTWEEYEKVMSLIQNHFELGASKRMMFYVRNLAFEFQFIRKHFTFERIFATEPHKVIYAITNNGFEFRCSYFLSGCSLETTGKNLIKYKAEKKVGDLDYNKIRTSKTPLNDKEIDYCLYDVIVDSNFIRESMEQESDNSLLKIPLTKTGYVRRYVKKYCLNKMNGLSYKKIINSMEMDEQDYYQLKRLFSGGFTHCNAINSGITFEKVKSFDFTSSYPAVLLLEKYPIGRGYRCNIKDGTDFITKLKTYCCMFDIEFINIRGKENIYESIISESKCLSIKNPVINNGRVVKADSLIITLNEVDFFNIRNFYDFDRIKVSNFKRYNKGYLPKPLLECIIKFYKDKTVLKDVKGSEIEYMLAKSNLNSVYGMMVTDPIKDNVLYENDEWSTELGDIQESLENFNNSSKRFIAYEWGVWCTSYARRNLFSGILELGTDFIYADTDSVKFINYDNHKKYFEDYNKIINYKIKKVCEFYKMNVEDFSPKTIKGKTKTIGVWDDDGDYKNFKTLGAKRYAVENYNDEFNITVSGINKGKAVPYIIKESQKLGVTPFEYFSDDMYVDCENCGKMLHTYLNTPIKAKIKDYLGNETEVVELSSVHLENSPYSLSLAEEYINYLKQIKTKYNKAC